MLVARASYEKRLHRSPHAALLEATAAEDGPTLCGAEGNCSFLIAVRADGAGLHFLVSRYSMVSVGSIEAEGSCPLGLAELATFGLILKLLVVEEQLLPGGENEITPAIHTSQRFILEFHRENTPSDGVSPCP